jgi:hypothetical protein
MLKRMANGGMALALGEGMMRVERETLAEKLLERVAIAKHVACLINKAAPKADAIEKIVTRCAMSDAERRNMAMIASECRDVLAQGIFQVVIEQKPKTREGAAVLVEEEVKLAQFEAIIELELIEYATETRAGVLQ